MIRRPVVDTAHFDRVWRERVAVLSDAYEMNEEPAVETGGSDPGIVQATAAPTG